jgi:hypothetical protein
VRPGGAWRLAAAAAAGAAAVLALAPGAVRAPAPAPAASPVEAPAPGDADRGRLAAVELQLALLGDAVGALASDAAGRRASGPAAEPPRAPAAGGAGDAEEAERRSREVLEDLELRLGGEPEDAAMAAFLTGALEARLAEEAGLGAALRSVACGATLCRLRFGLDEPAHAHPALLALTGLVPWDGEGVLYVPGEDPRTALLFVAREGGSLLGDAPGP